MRTGWELVSARWLFTEVDDRAGEARADELPLLSVSQTRGVIPREALGDEGRAESLVSYKVCSPGDVVLNRMSAYQGAVGRVTVEGVTSPDYMVMRPTDRTTARYLEYVVKSAWFVGEMSSRLRGIGTVGSAGVRTPRIGKRELGEIPVPLPRLPEQQAIADFLDRETAEIDAFIADQERLIELLTERRVALFSALLTKEARSPLAELIERHTAPPGWELTRLGRVVSIIGGQVDPQNEAYERMFLVAPNHVESWTGRITHLETAAEQGAESGKYLVRAGQVIYSKIRPTLMKCVVAPRDVLCSADMYGLTAKVSGLIEPEYLAAWLRSHVIHDYAAEESMRVAMPKLNHESVKAMPILLPPLGVQRGVVAAMAEGAAEIDASIADAREAIALSKERRAALISAAVTGKIDVALGTQSKRDDAISLT